MAGREAIVASDELAYPDDNAVVGAFLDIPSKPLRYVFAEGSTAPPE